MLRLYLGCSASKLNKDVYKLFICGSELCSDQLLANRFVFEWSE